jgi:hypothetical protein
MSLILYNPLKSDDILIAKMYLLIGRQNFMFLFLAAAKRDFYEQFRR